MTNCQARPGADGQVRCAACRLVWDADDAPPCPERPEGQDSVDAFAYMLEGLTHKQVTVPVPEPFVDRMGFVSGLPDPIRR